MDRHLCLDRACRDRARPGRLGPARVEVVEAARRPITPRQWFGFFALCLLGASGWLVEAELPGALPATTRQILDDLLMAIVLIVIGWKRVARGTLWSLGCAKLAAMSVLLLGVPATLAGIAAAGTPEVTATLLFALAPVMVVILLASFSLGAEEAPGINRLLAPALVGFAGILLLLPVAEPQSWREGGLELLVGFAVLLASLAGIRLHRLLTGFTVIEAAAICCLANALYYLAVNPILNLFSADASPLWSSSITWHEFALEAIKAFLLNLPQVVLLVWLMRDVSPARFAARYLAIPLLTVIEGYAILWPGFSLRTLGGIVLMAFGAWQLLTAPAREEEPGLVLR